MDPLRNNTGSPVTYPPTLDPTAKSSLNLEITPCKHYADVKALNGQLVSFCIKCGAILDQVASNAFKIGV